MGNLTQKVAESQGTISPKRADIGYEGAVLLDITWPGEKIYDDGKQSDRLTGASHPGCCKQ